MVIKNTIVTELQNHRTERDLQSHQVQPFIVTEPESKVLIVVLKSTCSEIENLPGSAQCPYSSVFYANTKTGGYRDSVRWMGGWERREGRKQGRPDSLQMMLSIKFLLCFVNACRK